MYFRIRVALFDQKKKKKNPHSAYGFDLKEAETKFFLFFFLALDVQ